MRLLHSISLLVLAAHVSAVSAAPSVTPGMQVYEARRAKLVAGLPKGAIAIINAAPHTDSDSPYRQHNNFWYLTGMPEAGAVAVLQPGAPAGKRYTLFAKAKKWEEEQWTGYRVGPDAAKTRYGADVAVAADQLPKQIDELMRDATSLWLMDGGDTKFRDQMLGSWNRRNANAAAALPVYNLNPTLAEMRLFKDATEEALLREAVKLSVDAHMAGFARVKAGQGEWTVRAAMVNTCAQGGALRMAYPPIVGSGINAVVLHYDAADQVMQPGAMIVNDTACEYGLYAADITRSYPVSGKFTPEQRAIYDVVHAAIKAGESALAIGVPLQKSHDATVDVIVDGLMKLGILKGSKAEIMAKKSYGQFYPHFSSHFLGLDVHDAGNHEFTWVPKEVPEAQRRHHRRAMVTIKPGMAFTIEPGIYIPANTAGVDKKWWNIGVRIEDDYFVTAQGVECLSCKLPRDIATIESLIGKD